MSSTSPRPAAPGPGATVRRLPSASTPAPAQDSTSVQVVGPVEYLALLDTLADPYRIGTVGREPHDTTARECLLDSSWAVALVGVILAQLPGKCRKESLGGQLQERIVGLLASHPERAARIWRCLLRGFVDYAASLSAVAAASSAMPTSEIEAWAVGVLSPEPEALPSAHTPARIVNWYREKGWTIGIAEPGNQVTYTPPGSVTPITISNTFTGTAAGTPVLVPSASTTTTSLPTPGPGVARVREVVSAEMQPATAPSHTTMLAWWTDLLR